MMMKVGVYDGVMETVIMRLSIERGNRVKYMIVANICQTRRAEGG